MDPCPTLQSLAAHTVAVRLGTDPNTLHSISQVVPELPSNIIYTELTKCSDSINQKVADAIALRLTLIQVDFTRIQLSKTPIVLIRLNKLQYFVLGHPKQFEQEVSRNFLKFMLRLIKKENRGFLLELDLSGRAATKADLNGQLSSNWSMIGKHFPSLHTLRLSYRLFSDSDLENIANSFSNLTTFDISNTLITSLDGISALQTLIMKGMIFENSEDIKDIAKLPNLKNLNVSFSISQNENKGFVELMAKERIALKALKFLDFSGTNTTAKEIYHLLDNFPKLTKMATVGTLAQEHKFNTPHVTFLSIASPHQAVNSLEYYTSEKIDSCVFTCIEYLCSLLKYPIPDLLFNADKCLKIICDATKTYQIYGKWRSLASKALVALVENYPDVFYPRHLYHACIKIEEMKSTYEKLEVTKEKIYNMWKQGNN